MSEVVAVKESKRSCIFQGAAPSSIAQGVTARFAGCLGPFPPHSRCGLLGEVDDKSEKAIDLVHYGRCCVSCQVLQKGKGGFKKRERIKTLLCMPPFLNP